jgi:folate-dependent phosphoribosylglycinamide formyltransferase PurN
MENRKIVLLCSACYATTVLYNYINESYPIDTVIEEKPMRGFALAKRRFKKLGFFKVSSQIAFSFLVVPFLGMTGRKRIAVLKKQFGFNDKPIPEEKIKRFDTVNDAGCIDLLKNIQPAIVLVSGTRIISKKVLESCPAFFINMHAGITPQYRGVHGGYWAVANNDVENFGVTIHRVDKGIDTGEVLYQQKIQVSPDDNYTTYPYLQLGEGLPLMKKAVADIFAGRLSPVIATSSDSRLWYHPTIWQYFFYKKKKKGSE